MKNAKATPHRNPICASRKRSQYRSRRGIALVWTALLLFLMILMVGLSIDWGKVTWNVHQLQNAADAAALAGAQVVKSEAAATAIKRAHDFGLMNWADQLPVNLRQDLQGDPFGGNYKPYDIILGRWVNYNRTFVPTLDAPNAVMAIARRGVAQDASAAPPLKLVFGPIAGVDTVDANQIGVAWCNDSGGSGLICLNESAVPGLEFTGTAILDVEGGGIHVNAGVFGSNNKSAAWVSGNALVDCGFINVVGQVDPPPDSSAWEGIFEGGIDDGAEGFSVTDGTMSPPPEPIEDPLASIMNGTPYIAPPGDHLDMDALLAAVPTHDIPTITASTTLTPGYYPNGLSITNGVSVTLDRGAATTGIGTLFIFGGAGLVVNGGSLTGQGVTCYITENVTTGEVGATDWGAGANVNLWSPGDWQNKDAADPDLSLVQGLNGIAVWQDPTMVDSKGDTPDVHLNGSPSGGVHGTLYFPDPIHVELNGDLGQMGNQILCGSAKINGTATINVDYDGRNTPGPTRHAVLVQ